MTYAMLPPSPPLLFEAFSLFLAFVMQAKHEFHETCHSVTAYFMKKYSKQCCDTTVPELSRPQTDSTSFTGQGTALPV